VCISSGTSLLPSIAAKCHNLCVSIMTMLAAHCRSSFGCSAQYPKANACWWSFAGWQHTSGSTLRLPTTPDCTAVLKLYRHQHYR
jgi:hypothetical protein